MGMGALVLVLMALAGWRLYGGFREIADQPFAPEEAGAALEERTPQQVEESRQEIDAQEIEDEEPAEERTPETIPPPEDEEEEPVEPEETDEEVPPEPEDAEEVSEPPPVAHARSSVKTPDARFDSVLLMGADASGYLADAILFALFLHA